MRTKARARARVLLLACIPFSCTSNGRKRIVCAVHLFFIAYIFFKRLTLGTAMCSYFFSVHASSNAPLMKKEKRTYTKKYTFSAGRNFGTC